MRWHWGFFFFVSATSAQLQIPFVNHAASQPQPAGPLVWGELNVLATTDIHGWLRGHASYGQQTAEETERNASGDLGDFYSFAIRMKALAAEQKRDLLLVDSGDLHDGNGLSDADPFIKGHTVMQLHRKLPYDITTIGNHELYNLTVAQDVHQTHARVLGERFLTSNVNITLASGESVPIGHRFRRWTTAQGRKLFALGVLFDFTGNAHGTVVQPVAAMLREEWLAEALYERPDAFVLVGHMSTRDDGWRAVIEHLHTRHPGVPVLTFAGHAHVRDCIQHTPASVTLASGRYFETIGWLSANISGPRLEFSRKYLDQNPTTYAYHLGLDRSSLSTSKGRGISAELQQYSHAWNLSHQFGTAPQSFYANRAPEWSSKSLLRLMTDVIFTTVMADTSRPLSHVMIMNTGGIRFDIFQGPFTTDSQWLVVPFESRHVFLPRVKRAHIEALLPALELHGPAIAARLRSQQALDDAQINADYAAHTRRMAALGQTDLEASTTSSLTEGYRTYDDCPGRGDDTLHRPIPSFAIPEYVTNALREGENEFDLAWFDFLTPLILATLNTVQQEYHYVQADVSVYSAIKEDEMLGVFARKYW
ncbi:uncharacterized protein L969DRAFT_19756 [Mixia osmundae IAM 14324]|uniref:Uncharacterized protein n=1 Tax=Mixia osmundae (strain CBS 9802 / IAM 14324 / JCM 22182 / KY 12970) TaxID=764103 RepID=G7DSZ7_MIXOS|nr:uncharacterized protein L969DRAFT_19756 [Mixia osmundae IAM 14324]KEI37221.1 hypothetical protein L969DRAFT_19756 [Mixia osmundae IAM 14324]GAA93707.1 hypothetical protein E5Q_00353 [Mixia osmundae IAM 14324]